MKRLAALLLLGLAAAGCGSTAHAEDDHAWFFRWLMEQSYPLADDNVVRHYPNANLDAIHGLLIEQAQGVCERARAGATSNDEIDRLMADYSLTEDEAIAFYAGSKTEFCPDMLK